MDIKWGTWIAIAIHLGSQNRYLYFVHYGIDAISRYVITMAINHFSVGFFLKVADIADVF